MKVPKVLWKSCEATGVYLPFAVILRSSTCALSVRSRLVPTSTGFVGPSMCIMTRSSKRIASRRSRMSLRRRDVSDCVAPSRTAFTNPMLSVCNSMPGNWARHSRRASPPRSRSDGHLAIVNSPTSSRLFSRMSRLETAQMASKSKDAWVIRATPQA